MPRKARRQSALDLYHVIIKGINKNIIFEDEKDFNTFLSILKHYQKKEGFSVYAYCMMSNHIHLLLGETHGELGNIMRKMLVTFAMWYNTKYERNGYVFQERFRSEAIEDEGYFLRALRYIHQNPLHAGLEKQVGEYRWSSFNEYKMRDGRWVNIDRARLFFESYDGLIRFLETEVRELGMEEKSYRSFTDEETRELILQYTSCKSLKEFGSLDKEQFGFYIGNLVEAGISVRQLARLTGKGYRKLKQIVDEQKIHDNSDDGDGLG